jgi:predicted PurR-regulated permease PerM
MNTRYIAITVAFVVLGAVFYYFSNIVTYVLIAWVLSMIGQPIMNFYKRIPFWKWRLGNGTAAALTLLTFLLIFGGLVAMFVPSIVAQIEHLQEVDYTKVTKTLEQPLAELNNLGKKYGVIPSKSNVTTQVEIYFKDWIQHINVGTLFTSVFSTATGLLATFVSVAFILFFFLQEQGMFVGFLSVLLPKKYDKYVHDAVEDIQTMLTRYFTGLLIQSSIIATLISLVLSILGIKNAILIGAFAALINVIPYVGPLISLAFATLITISANLDLDFYSQILPMLLTVWIVLPTTNMIDGFIIQPYIFSNSVLAHPLEIFIVILIGADLFGVPGMILAIPTYTVLRAIARVFFDEYRIVQKLTETMDEHLD